MPEVFDGETIETKYHGELSPRTHSRRREANQGSPALGSSIHFG